MREPVIFVAALMLPGIAWAQEAVPDPVQSLTACRAITASDARLACYDQAATALQTAREQKQIVVLDQAEVKKTRRSLFGFAMPRIKFLEGDGEPEPQIDTSIDWTRSLGNGKWAFRTVEGANWQTTEASDALPRTGDKLTIKRGAIGGYFVKFGKSRAVRAMRLN